MRAVVEPDRTRNLGLHGFQLRDMRMDESRVAEVSLVKNEVAPLEPAGLQLGPREDPIEAPVELGVAGEA